MKDAINFNSRCLETRTTNDFRPSAGSMPANAPAPQCFNCAYLSPDAGAIDPQRFCLNSIGPYFDVAKGVQETCVNHSYGSRFKKEDRDIV